MAAIASRNVSERVKNAAKRVGVGFKEVANAGGSYSAHVHRALGVDNSLNMEHFKNEFTAVVLEAEDDQFVFELVGIDAPIANALRRILLSEVPTMAIETVFVHDNSSIMPDEMLAHRIGLVPLNVDPRVFKMRASKDSPASPNDTLKFRLRAQCTRNTSSAPKDNIAPPEKLYLQSTVVSGGITYVPFPGKGDEDQLVALGLGEAPKPVHDDIVLVKMRPGQRVHLEMDAVKGIGRDHAKFSPVATASYRMLPEVTLKKEVSGERAMELVEKCPMKVFDIEDMVAGCARVARPRACTMCRECIREPEWNDVVELTRKRDHFIFSVESTGALPGGVLVTEALSILSEKCKDVEAALEEAIKRRTPTRAQARNDSNDDNGDGDENIDDDED
jgi:DNA-directed RNA polymerases I and III subunit RPAC1